MSKDPKRYRGPNKHYPMNKRHPATARFTHYDGRWFFVISILNHMGTKYPYIFIANNNKQIRDIDRMRRWAANYVQHRHDLLLEVDWSTLNE